MSEPVWTRVGLPTYDEMIQFFRDCHPWVEHSEAKVLAKWLTEDGGLEQYRSEVAEWQERTRAKRNHQAARVEFAEYTPDAEAWRLFAQFGPCPPTPEVRQPVQERRLSPPCNEPEMRADHRILIAYVDARRRGLTHEDIMAATKALPVLETYYCPEMCDWLDSLAEPATGPVSPDPWEDQPMDDEFWPSLAMTDWGF